MSKYLKTLWIVIVYIFAIYGAYKLFYDNLDTWIIEQIETQRAIPTETQDLELQDPANIEIQQEIE